MRYQILSNHGSCVRTTDDLDDAFQHCAELNSMRGDREFEVYDTETMQYC